MSAAAGPGAGGYVDLWGPTGDPGRSIVAGWLGQPWKEAVTRGKLRVEADTAAGTVRCNATAMVFAREDVAAIGVGVILLCDTPVSALAAARFFDISTGDQTCRLRLAPGARYVDAPALSEAVRPLVARAHPLDHRNIAIASLDLRETGYTATADFTLAVELVLACDEAGLLALATVAASDVAVERAAVLAGRSRQQVDPALIIAGPPRPDRGGARISLAMRLHEAPPAGSERWLEITLADGRTARAALPPAITPGRDALLKALAAIDPDADIDRLFDNVMGPAIGALQAARTRLPVSVTEANFGTPPRKPRATLIIPLYARVDLMEVQLALFCGQPCMDDTEILFVVDDPPLQPDARALAASAYARFRLPFRLLQPNRNLGFAAASNLGLAAARAPFVCFMNSDVFPNSPDWLTRLIAHLEADGARGLVAPMLLFPDGSVQHRGMEFQPMPRHGGWHFPRHTGKGRRPSANGPPSSGPSTTGPSGNGPSGSGLQRVAAVTGACIVMRRTLATALSGFDEAFVIGDFEDADLCQRAARAGFSCAVDLDVRATHLERQSQAADAPWRLGATLYNAWLHERRWFPAPAVPAPAVPAPAVPAAAVSTPAPPAGRRRAR